MRLSAFFLLVLFASNMPIKPHRNSDQSNSAANREREPSVVVVNNQAPAPKAEHGENKAPKWDASVGANWALVVVGILTFIAVWYQAKKTAQATTTMMRSLELQELNFRQWVNT